MELYDYQGKQIGLKEVIKWFLEHYEGIEHMTAGGSTDPETWYTITAILRRCLKKIQK